MLVGVDHQHDRLGGQEPDRRQQLGGIAHAGARIDQYHALVSNQNALIANRAMVLWSWFGMLIDHGINPLRQLLRRRYTRLRRPRGRHAHRPRKY